MTRDEALAILASMVSRPVLVIACGNRKQPSRSQGYPVRQIYLGPLWTTYRKWLDDHGLHDKNPVDVWVISAKHGLIPENQVIPVYNTLLTKASEPAFVQKLKRQLQASSRVRLREGPVTYAGPFSRSSPPYLSAMEKVGMDVTAIRGAGYGYMRQNLRSWLDQHVR